MDRQTCDHNNAEWQPKPEADVNGITYHGQCLDCGAPLQEVWYEKLDQYQNQAGEWVDY
jgi:hypothetical protein